MPPKIKNLVVWQQAELLMQPAFLRILDNIRKQLEESVWKGTYEERLVWPEGVTEETKARVQQLKQQLAEASPEKREEIEEALMRLPQPYPGYRLILQHQSQQFTIDLWELCYQVCFCNYNLVIVDPDHVEVEIDTSLIDETGDVDWNRLDEKAQRTVKQIFTNLPII